MTAMKTVRTSPLGVAILGLLLAALPVQGGRNLQQFDSGFGSTPDFGVSTGNFGSGCTSSADCSSGNACLPSFSCGSPLPDGSTCITPDQCRNGCLPSSKGLRCGITVENFPSSDASSSDAIANEPTDAPTDGPTDAPVDEPTDAPTEGTSTSGDSSADALAPSDASNDIAPIDPSLLEPSDSNSFGDSSAFSPDDIFATGTADAPSDSASVNAPIDDSSAGAPADDTSAEAPSDGGLLLEPSTDAVSDGGDSSADAPADATAAVDATPTDAPTAAPTADTTEAAPAPQAAGKAAKSAAMLQVSMAAAGTAILWQAL